MRRAATLVGALVIAMGSAACDVCDGGDAIDGPITLRTQDDVDDFVGALCVRGDLEVGSDINNGVLETNDSIVDLESLEDVQIVEGDLNISGNNVLVEARLPALRYAGRRLLDADNERVRGGLFVQANPVLQQLELPALTDVGGCFKVQGNPALDPGDVDDLFLQTRSHAFPGSCEPDQIEENVDNGTAR